MIFSHIDYCFDIWSFACTTTLKPIKQLFRRSIKVFDRKPNSYHHCVIMEICHFLNFDNYKIFKNVCLIYKCLHGLAPPPLKEFIYKKRDSGQNTRADARGNCEVHHKVCLQSVFSVEGSHSWNTLPANIRDSPTLCSFINQLKAKR